MGACQSSQNGVEEEKKKRSRQIDAKLLEDERRLRRECKILLLGMLQENDLAMPRTCINKDQVPEKAESRQLSNKWKSSTRMAILEMS